MPLQVLLRCPQVHQEVSSNPKRFQEEAQEEAQASYPMLATVIPPRASESKSERGPVARVAESAVSKRPKRQPRQCALVLYFRELAHVPSPLARVQ